MKQRQEIWSVAKQLFWAGIAIFGLVALISLLFLGCTTLNQDPAIIHPIDANPQYRHDLIVSVNGSMLQGIGVMPKAAKYQIVVYPESSIDRIIWTTCNRQEVVDKPEKGFWQSISGNNSYSFELDPVSGLEDVKACALQISVLTERQNETGFALIDFDDSRLEYQKVKATVKCNGQLMSNTGVLICQSAEGLIQEITFDRPVLPATPDPGCSALSDVDGKRTRYRWDMAPAKCLYLFGDKDGNRFRLTSVGYNEVPYRE